MANILQLQQELHRLRIGLCCCVYNCIEALADGDGNYIITITDGDLSLTPFSPVSGFTCTDLESCDTDSLPEGATNLYFTCERVTECLGIDEVTGDPTLFLNQKGDWETPSDPGDTVNTTDSTPTVISSVATGVDTVFGVEAIIVAKEIGGVAGSVGDGFYGKIFGTFTNISGVITQIDSTTTEVFGASQRDIDENPEWLISFDISAPDIDIIVQGLTDENISWQSRIIVTQI